MSPAAPFQVAISYCSSAMMDYRYEHLAVESERSPDAAGFDTLLSELGVRPQALHLAAAFAFMNIETTAIPGPLVVTPSRIGDERGFFSEVFRKDLFEKEAGPFTFVQDNHSVSSRRGVLRGLHFQRDPHAQGKLVRVARGAIFDVAVDVREGSKTFGRHVAVELTAENWKQLWVPPGFLHGFCTLSQEAEVLYKVTSFYNPECDGCVAHDDPDLGLLWPFARDELSLSPKDARAPRLKDIAPPFPIGASST